MANVTICLTNPKSPTNVGGVMRAVGCFGANQVLYTGNRYDIAKKFHTDTQNVSSSIGLVHVDDFYEEKPKEVPLVCIELVEGAMPLTDFEHPEDAFYLLGPEDGSVKQEWVDRAEHVVYVPTNGSLNLAATVNVLLYDRLAKSQIDIDHQSLIKQSRDVNNRLSLVK